MTFCCNNRGHNVPFADCDQVIKHLKVPINPGHRITFGVVIIHPDSDFFLQDVVLHLVTGTTDRRPR